MLETDADSGFAESNNRPETTLKLTRGVCRLFLDMGCAVLTEMRLANGRRADIMAIDPKGSLTLVEIKSCQLDYVTDHKWPEYLDWCDAFYFAVDCDFPQNLIPSDTGLIIADGFGGSIVRSFRPRKLSAARRKAVTLRFARQAAFQILK